MSQLYPSLKTTVRLRHYLHGDVTYLDVIVSEPGLFEFSKTSLIMRSKTTLGRLSVIRSLGTDGHVIVPWIAEAIEGEFVPPGEW